MSVEKPLQHTHDQQKSADVRDTSANIDFPEFSVDGVAHDYKKNTCQRKK